MDENLRMVKLLHVRGRICRRNGREPVTVHAYVRSVVFCEMVLLFMATWHLSLGADAIFYIYAVPRLHFANRIP